VFPKRCDSVAVRRLVDSVGVVAAPRPHERIRQCLLENAAVAVARAKAEYEAVVVTPALSAAAVRSPAITQL